MKLPDLKLHPNIFSMSPMSLVNNCSSPQAPHPSQVPMPTELCSSFSDMYKPITSINNNHYIDNQFCYPLMDDGDSSNTISQGNFPRYMCNNLDVLKYNLFLFLGKQCLVQQMNEHFHS